MGPGAPVRERADSHRRRGMRDDSLQRWLQRSAALGALASGFEPIRLRSTEPKVSGSNPDGRVQRFRSRKGEIGSRRPARLGVTYAAGLAAGS
jgi:hypothetical protein